MKHRFGHIVSNTVWIIPGIILIAGSVCSVPAPKGPPVHPGSAANLDEACRVIEKQVGYVLTGQKVLPGLTLGEVSTDAGLCEFGGSTIALNLFYSQDGTLLVIR